MDPQVEFATKMFEAQVDEKMKIKQNRRDARKQYKLVHDNISSMPFKILILIKFVQ